MGLKIHSLGRVPSDIDRAYFVYLLDYGWDEPLSRGLRANFDKMASLASRNNAIVIAGFDGEEFTNEVFDYHRINGQPGNEILPAILITTCHPHKFAEQNQFPARSRFHENAVYDDRMVLIPLKPACRSETDVADLVEKIFRDIKERKQLSEFEIHRQIVRGDRGALVDALVLQPNMAGIGLDLKVIGRFLWQGVWPKARDGST
jgi:hypothetical protein